MAAAPQTLKGQKETSQDLSDAFDHLVDQYGFDAITMMANHPAVVGSRQAVLIREQMILKP